MVLGSGERSKLLPRLSVPKSAALCGPQGGVWDQAGDADPAEDQMLQEWGQNRSAGPGQTHPN